jgi:hypothetical protein
VQCCTLADGGISSLYHRGRRGFLRAIELVCPDGDTAKKYARQVADAHDVELWQGDRQVAKYDNRLK